MSKIISSRMSKKELRQALVNLGYAEEQLVDNDGKKLKREALVEKYKAHQDGNDGLRALTTIVETPDTPPSVQQSDNEEVQELIPPTPNEVGWTQHVLGKFLPDEIDGQNPRVEGLRRVASELVGELIEEGCDLVAAPCEANGYRACAKAWGVFLTSDGREKRFEALADANETNCFEDYATYLVAMADTRAKGRVFRNALMLRRVVSAEEVSKTSAITADIQGGGAIHSGQISMIRILTDRMNISIPKLLASMGIPYEINEQSCEVNLKALPYEDALIVTKQLNKIRQDGETPEELKENK